MPTATIEVDSEVYRSAGESFLQANDSVCDIVAAAATTASAGGGMAGSDAAAVGWAASYDLAARQALVAGAGLADGLGEFAIRLCVSADNHGGAEQTSVPGAPSFPGSAAAPSAGRVLPAMPPSAAGGSTSPPGVCALVAHLLPFSWPGGDPARLRTIATGWTNAGTSLQDAADRLSGPIGDLSAQQSPEVEVAVGRCTDAQLAVRSLAEAYGSLGRACTTLADHVQGAPDQLTAALGDVGDLASASLDVATAVVTGDDVKQQLQELIETLPEILDRLVHLIEGAVEALADIASRIAALIGQLVDMVATVATTAFTLSVASAAAVKGIGSTSDPRIDLTAMEAAGGHTIAEHVGRTDEELVDRAEQEGLDRTSTFSDLETATALTALNIAQNRKAILKWLGKQKNHGVKTVKCPAPPGSGRVYVAATGQLVEPSTVVTVLVKTGVGTFIVLTSCLEL